MKSVLLVLLLLTSTCLFAADASGSWTGELLVPSDGGEQSRPAHLVLKQDGTKLTGTAGPNAGEQHPIESGKIEDGVISFQIAISGSTMSFSLKLEGDQIKGDVTRERDGQTQRAKLSVKREK